MTGVAITVARIMGRSRTLSLFAALVAAAGLVNELERRRERGSNAEAEG
jgi:hypothetical protein